MQKRCVMCTVCALLVLVLTLSAVPFCARAEEGSDSSAKKTMYVGGDNYKIKLKNLSADAKVTYVSGNKSVAEVTDNGVVKPKSKGETTVTVSIVQNGKTYERVLYVTVVNPYVKFLNTVNELEVGSTYKLDARVAGLHTTKIVYTSSNESVAEIDAKTRILTVKARGTATITVKDKISGLQSSFSLKAVGEDLTPTRIPTPTKAPANTPIPTKAPANTPTPVPEDEDWAEDGDGDEDEENWDEEDEYGDEEEEEIFGYEIEGKEVVITEIYDSSLESLVIPSVIEGKKVTAIGDYALSDLTELVRVTLPASITTLGDGAFSGCTMLKSITIPASVTKIPDSCFSSCESLTGVTISGKVTYFGDSAFEQCESLKSISIPSTVTYIGDFCFSSCVSLTSVTLPSSLKTIGSGAFEYCELIRSVKIPAAVTEVGSGAFDGCSESFKMQVKKNSAGYEYAVDNEIPYTQY